MSLYSHGIFCQPCSNHVHEAINEMKFPERELSLDYDLIVFSSECNYQNPQFTVVRMRNKSANEWILFRIKSYYDDSQKAGDYVDSDYSDETIDEKEDRRRRERMKKIVLPFKALPNVGLVAPGEMAEFKLILPSYHAWKHPRKNLVGRRTNIRIRQMRVNDPKALFGSEILDAGSEALKSKLLKLYEAISHNKENDFDFNVNSCEKIYSRNIPVFLPNLMNAEENIETAASSTSCLNSSSTPCLNSS